MNRSEFIRTWFLGLGGTYFLSSNVFGESTTIEQGEYKNSPHFVNRGNGFGNRIAITFDDGPTPGVTDIVLKELEKRNLRATFFMIGNKVKQTPSLAKEVADAGHEIGNHSYTHSRLDRMSDSKVKEEIRKTQEAVFEATGKTPLWFRPPYGAFKRTQGNLAYEEKVGIVYWSVDPRDWSRPGVPSIISRVVDSTTPGSIILLHDLHKQTAEATGSTLEKLLEKTFHFANLTRFLGTPYI